MSWRLPRRGNSPFSILVEISKVTPDIRYQSDDRTRNKWHDNEVLEELAAARSSGAADDLRTVLLRDCHHPLPLSYSLDVKTHAGVTTAFRDVDCKLPSTVSDPRYGCELRKLSYSQTAIERFFDPTCCSCSNSTSFSCGDLDSAESLDAARNRLVCGAALRHLTSAPSPPDCSPQIDLYVQFCGVAASSPAAQNLSMFNTTGATSTCISAHTVALQCLASDYLVCGAKQCARPASPKTVDLFPSGKVEEDEYFCLLRRDESAGPLFQVKYTLQVPSPVGGLSSGGFEYVDVGSYSTNVVASDATAATAGLVETKGASGLALNKRPGVRVEYSSGNGEFAEIVAADASTGAGIFIERLRPEISTQTFHAYEFSDAPIRAATKWRGELWLATKKPLPCSPTSQKVLTPGIMLQDSLVSLWMPTAIVLWQISHPWRW
jgi:hypothetical protein